MDQGARAGSVLRGAGLNNQGLRLRVLQEQARGNGGGIKGGFVILDEGDNMHSQSLRALLQRVTDAEEVVGVIRQHHAGCVNVANASILVVEGGRPAGRPPHEGKCPDRGERQAAERAAGTPHGGYARAAAAPVGAANRPGGGGVVSG